MSWGYWGIVAGLLALVAIFFVSMDLLYAGTKGVRQAPRSPADGQADAGKQPTRLAA